MPLAGCIWSRQAHPLPTLPSCDSEALGEMGLDQALLQKLQGRLQKMVVYTRNTWYPAAAVQALDERRNRCLTVSVHGVRQKARVHAGSCPRQRDWTHLGTRARSGHRKAQTALPRKALGISVSDAGYRRVACCVDLGSCNRHLALTLIDSYMI